LDIVIPEGMGGEETLKHLRKIDLDIKAIVSSGYPYNPIILEYIKYGFNVAITKPFSALEINKLIEKLSNKNKE
jgi:two-component system, cell cycle sensor histidine kinase and response regulator CckA